MKRVAFSSGYRNIPDNIASLFLCAPQEFAKLLDNHYLQIRNNKFVFIKNQQEVREAEKKANIGCGICSMLDYFLYSQQYEFETVEESDLFICQLCAHIIPHRPIHWEYVDAAFNIYNPSNDRKNGDTKSHNITKKLEKLLKFVQNV